MKAFIVIASLIVIFTLTYISAQAAEQFPNYQQDYPVEPCHFTGDCKPYFIDAKHRHVWCADTFRYFQAFNRDLEQLTTIATGGPAPNRGYDTAAEQYIVTYGLIESLHQQLAEQCFYGRE